MECYKPKNIIDAEKLHGNSKAVYYLAGGTQINSAHSESKTIKTLIDLRGLNIHKITKNEIGAMATLQDILDSNKVHQGIKESVAHIVNRNIRNIATIGGNIGSLKSSSDMIPALIVLSASVKCVINGITKEMLLEEWIKTPAGLIIAVLFKSPKRKVFQKRYSRTKNDIAILKFAAGYQIKSDKICDVIIAVGSIDKTVMMLKRTAKYLYNKKRSEISLERLKQIAQAEIKPISDIRSSADYRRILLDESIEKFIGGIWK